MDDWMKGFLTIFVSVLLAFTSLFAKNVTKTDATKAEVVTELTGRPIAKRPDIILFELRPNAPVSTYKVGFEKLAKAGASIPAANLSMQRFRTSGIERMLEVAGYLVLPVNDSDWGSACAHINEFLKYQALHREMEEDGVRPLCLLYSAEASPETFYEDVAPILASGALIFFTTPPEIMIPPFPLVVVWDRYVWPDHLVENPVSLHQWIPTLAEVVGVLPPADVIEPSILPSLTGVGYQRPNEVRPAQTKSTFVTLRSYTLPATSLQYTHWLPSVENMIPDVRQYVDGTLPLEEKVLEDLKPSLEARVILVRSNLSRFSLSLPETISVVIKKNGVPVYSTWQKPCEWTEILLEPIGFEFLFFIPAGVDPTPVKTFLTHPTVFAKSATTTP